MFELSANVPPPLSRKVTWLLVAWFVLSLPVLVLFPVIPLAFDSGPSVEGYCFAWSVWTYPLTFGIAWLFRRR